MSIHREKLSKDKQGFIEDWSQGWLLECWAPKRTLRKWP